MANVKNEKTKIDGREISLFFDLDNPRDIKYYKEYTKALKRKNNLDKFGAFYYVFSFFVSLIFVALFISQDSSLIKGICCILVVAIFVLFFILKHLSNKADTEFNSLALKLENTLIHLEVLE